MAGIFPRGRPVCLPALNYEFACNRGTIIMAMKAVKTTIAKPAKSYAKATSPKTTAKSVTDDLIAQIAYGLWQQDGQPHGKDQDHWHRAVEIANAKKLIAAKKATANSDMKSAPKAATKRA
jgi:hypothetical protein